MRSLVKNILCTLWFTLTQILCLSVSFAEESLSSTSGEPGLSLFVDVSQQRLLDQKSMQESSVDLLPDEPIERSIAQQDNADSKELDSLKEVPDLIERKVRYDGIVSRGGNILGVWLDRTQLLGQLKSENIDLTAVDTVGRLSINTGSLSQQISPGDYIVLSGRFSYHPTIDENKALQDAAEPVAKSDKESGDNQSLQAPKTGVQLNADQVEGEDVL